MESKSDFNIKIEGWLQFNVRDGSTWRVPVWPIALNRARNYADEFDDDVQRSLDEDTVPFFLKHHDEIYEWVVSNMDWDDVAPYAEKERDAPPMTPYDYNEDWMSGDFMKRVKDVKAVE